MGRALCLLLLLLAPAHAVDDPQALADEAAAAFRAGMHEEALTLLKRLEPRVTGDARARVLRNIARCHEEAGRVLVALGAYDVYLGAERDEARKASARARMAELLLQTGTVSGRCETEGVELSLLGQPHPARPCPGTFERLLPGRYVLRGSRAAQPPVDIDVEVAAGEHPSVLVPAPIPGVEAATRPPPKPAALEITGWTAVALGGAGLVAGGVLTGLAHARQGDADDLATRARPGTAGDLRAAEGEARGLETGSFVSYGVGADLALTGAVLLWLGDAGS